jgi:two-component system CheB/CheR fusion protein
MTIEPEDHELEELLNFLKDTRGFDFTGYKRSSLMRRVTKRMEGVGVEGFAQYQDYLQVHPDEFTHLFNFILINVTGFLRDPPIWDFVAESVIPALIDRTDADEPIRSWCAGVASGEEAYSVAMLLAEVLGVEEFQRRVKVYGTDVDEEALGQARQATYTEKDVEPVPETLRKGYFDLQNDHYVFNRDLRRNVIFGRHDLVQDAPISKIDLLLCRNTLMYLNAETQSRVMEHFHFALNPGGFLVLGKAEMLFTRPTSFEPVDLKRRVFAKSGEAQDLRERLMIHAEPQDVVGLPDHGGRDAAFEVGPAAQLIVDRAGTLLLANHRARDLFGLGPRDVGKPLQDLELSYRPVELRSQIDLVYSSQASIRLTDVPWDPRGGDGSYFDVEIVPLRDPARVIVGVSVTFMDVTQNRTLRTELERSNEELETALEELQSSNEELETTNEELQSTNEELETTNEELQSTNEELETMNEELQSTNEELQTVNEETRERGRQLDTANVFLGSVMTSVHAAVVVVDSSGRVLVWNRKAEDLWGLREDEVRGQPLSGVDAGFPVTELSSMIGTALEGASGHQEVILDATNRRGKAFRCAVHVTPLRGEGQGIEGAIVLMEEARAPEEA